MVEELTKWTAEIADFVNLRIGLVPVINLRIKIRYIILFIENLNIYKYKKYNLAIHESHRWVIR